MVKNRRLNVLDVALIAASTAILFVQEQLFQNIPGIQLTVFLIVLYSKVFGLSKTSIIIILYVFLDNLYMSSFNMLYTPTMLLGWLIIPLSLCTIFKKIESPLILAILGMVYAFIYSWLYIIPNYFLLNIGPIEYLISDFLFEIILAICSFISIFWLYKPCYRIINLLLYNNEEHN